MQAPAIVLNAPTRVIGAAGVEEPDERLLAQVLAREPGGRPPGGPSDQPAVAAGELGERGVIPL
jgi:hypothetical protein